MEPISPPAADRGRLGLAISLCAGLAAAAWGLARCAPPWATDGVRALAAAQQEGKAPPVGACVDVALWPALAFAAVVLAGLLAALRWWGKRMDGAGPFPPMARVPRAALVGLLAAVAVGAAVRGPRLAQSFWNDEETTLQDYAWGEWKEAKGGAWKFRPVPWQDTIFYNRGGSNHVLNSVLTRLTLMAADAADGPPSGHFSEAEARAIPFAASLATIFLLGWVLARAGMPAAGAVAAALLVAVHPWHLRYSVEIRGYSVMLACMLGATACLVEAVSSGRRRWWAGFAACQSAFLLSFPGSVYFAAALNLAALVGCVVMGRRPATDDGVPPRGKAAPTIIRLLAWNALSVLPVLVVMAPSIPQFSYYLAEGKRMISFAPGGGWEMDFYSHLLAGVPPIDPAPGESQATAFAQLPGRLILIVLSVMAVAGLVFASLRRGCPALRLVLVVLVAAPLLSYAHNRLAGNPTMPWYLLYALLALAAGLGGIIPGGPRWGRIVSVLILVGVFARAVAPADLREATVPRQPLREAAAAMRGASPTYGVLGDTRALTATFGTSAKRLRSYDPRVQVLKSPADLDALVERARREQVPLRVAFCGRRLALTSPERPEDRALVRRIEDPASGFRLIADLQGMEELFSYHVWEMR